MRQKSILTGESAKRAVFDALLGKGLRALRRNPGNCATFSPAPNRRDLFRVSARDINRMVREGDLQWINPSRSAAQLRRPS